MTTSRRGNGAVTGVSQVASVIAPAPSAMAIGNVSTASRSTSLNLSAGLPAPQDIANTLLQLASNEEEPDPLTHLRLQKLMYYVQAWSLANRGRPAFSGRIEAWAHGPVVKELYPFLADYGSGPIPFDALQRSASPLTQDDAAFVSSVWEAYKGFTAFSLRQMTHNDDPWIAARGTAGPADRCENEISHESMRRYFTSRNRRRA